MPFTIAPLGSHCDEQKSPAGGAAACIWEKRAAAARKNARGRAYVEEGIVEEREYTGQGGGGGGMGCGTRGLEGKCVARGRQFISPQEDVVWRLLGEWRGDGPVSVALFCGLPSESCQRLETWLVRVRLIDV